MSVKPVNNIDIHTMNYANLYVEKCTNGVLLLDFITESEFIYFRNNGDYTDNMRLNEYYPTMLLFHNVKKINLIEGDIIKVPMQDLIEHKRSKHHFFQNETNEEKPYGVFFSYVNSDWFENLFLYGKAYKNNASLKKFVEHIDGSWNRGSPCSLERLKDNICVEVVDVGQGSANLIYDENHISIFDFGANMFATKSELKNIVDNIQTRLNDFFNPSLIISHWDFDHYNLLTVVEEQFVKNLCCVFIPADVISLTAKQIIRKLKINCDYIRTISSPTPKNRKNISIIPAIIGDRYMLYVGEKSKDKNKSGLALAVKSDVDATILSSDHTNKYQVV